jgi:cytochrome P450
MFSPFCFVSDSLLKGMIPAFTTSCSKMVARWQKMASPQGPFEVDIWPELQKLTADFISRAAFGSNYEEGKQIFELQKELITLALEAMQTIYIPGFRYVACIELIQTLFCLLVSLQQF